MTTWRILAVDDEPINLDIILEILDQPEFALVTAANGDAAWQALQGQEFDLIILDRMMPGLDGLSLLRRIKQHEQYHRIPVIMQTAASSPDQVREGVEAGAYYYLTKPYEPKTLLAIVRAANDSLAAGRENDADLRRRARVIAMVDRADFRFRTLDDAMALADVLSGLCPEAGMARTAITELLINAIEHGNLGIGYREKSALCLQNAWHAEVARRLADPRWCDRYCELQFVRDSHHLRLTIRDQGDGFDFERYFDIEASRAFDPNGRGIALARRAGRVQVEYQGKGNVVILQIALEQP